MASKAKRKPRAINRMGGLSLLHSVTREQLDEKQLRDLGLAYLMALRGMTTGNGMESMWHTLACSLNVAMVLAELGIMPQGLSVIQTGQDALLKVRAHAELSDKWELGIHSFAVECAFKFHNLQLESAGRGHVLAALAEVHRRLDARRIL